MSERTINVLDGSTFVVGDRDGNVVPGGGREHGFFTDDTRFVSRWVLRVDDAPLALLGVDQATHFSARFFLTPLLAPTDAAPYSVFRRRLLGEVWREQVTVVSHQTTPQHVQVACDVDTDFADLFEVKDGTVGERAIERVPSLGGLAFRYSDGGFHRALTITSSREATVTPAGFAYELELSPGEIWSTEFVFTPTSAQPGDTFERRTRSSRSGAEQEAHRRTELTSWIEGAPTLDADDPDLVRTYRASLADLAALRVHPELQGAATFPAAGLPWFMALFGRDSLIASFQLLPFRPGLAATTLRILASRQATTRDDFHEQEPGKILHELRFGELTARRERPHSPYFGSADATPLFVVLLDEYHRWTGDDALVAALEPNARAALAWLEDSGDLDGDGYVEYLRRNTKTGLRNQCWKDSWDSMQFADGRLAPGAIASSEIQGYAYDARVRGARLAREVWNDAPFAAALEARAAQLRQRFRNDFWIADGDYCALALDGEKRQVDGLASNIGQLLWSGILEEEQAAAVAAHLVSAELFSGWGVRTLARRAAGYNPLGYHTGTIWPHDNALIVAGLMRYGHLEAAATIGGSVLRVAPYFEHRLPEVFAGYPAETTGVPVAYPTASRPQAWAAGAPLLILTALSGLSPGNADHDAILPGGLGRVSFTRRST